MTLPADTKLARAALHSSLADGVKPAISLIECLTAVTASQVRQRGADYVGKVRGILGGISGVSAEVRGSEDYEVSLRRTDDALLVSCTCPYFFDRAEVCKHIWAVALVAVRRGWLSDLPHHLRVVVDLEEAFDGASPFDQLPSKPAPPVPAPVRAAPHRPAPWETVLASVIPVPHFPSVGVLPGAELLYVILAPTQATLSEMPLHIERRERKRDNTWGKPQPARLTTEMIAALPDPEDRWVLSLLHAHSSYGTIGWASPYATTLPIGPSYLKRPLVELIMPRLCATGRVRLRQAQANLLPLTRSDVDVPLVWDDGPPWRFRLAVTGGRDTNYRVEGLLVRDDQRLPLSRSALLMDGLVVIEDVAARFEMAGGARWIAELRSRAEVTVPGGVHRGLREAIVRSGVQDVDLPDDLAWENRTVMPRPRLIVGPPGRYNGACPLLLEFEYRGHDCRERRRPRRVVGRR